MSTMKNVAHKDTEARRQFAADAYDYHDDVTKEAVDKVRAKAARQLEKADLELVDGIDHYAV